MTLDTYNQKRDFRRTPEPAAEPPEPAPALEARQFVVHMHDATRLHYDLRLELDGVLKCWAVPKGPSLDPTVRRLAVHTEDHPLKYLSFEGVIPQGEYGGGPMLVWDRGLWFPEGDVHAAYAKGHLRFRLEGEKARGVWNLIKTGAKGGTDRKGGKGGKQADKQWMLIKSKDAFAEAEAVPLVDAHPRSVRTGRDIDAVLAAGVDATLRDVIRAGDPSAMPGAVEAALEANDLIPPQLATVATKAPAGDAWLAEIKLDGYRLVALKEGAKVRLLTRSGQDWTRRFADIAASIAALPVKTAALDGEVVVYDARGRSDFGALQQALGPEARFSKASASAQRMVYVAFDLMHLDGWDLRAAQLVARKEALRLLLCRRASADPIVRFSDHFAGRAEDMLREACALGLEGIVAKRSDAPWVSGRSRTWVKVKCLARQELVIVGYTGPKGARGELGALLLGVNDGGNLRYAGKVGTGFGATTLRDLAAKLAPLERKTAPVTNAPRARGIHWVEPRLVAEVAFNEWTKDGVVRQASFVGLREDKPAGEVMREGTGAGVGVGAGAGVGAGVGAGAGGAKPRPRAVTQIGGVRVTHPDKVLFPDLGITKGELAEYYQAVAPLVVAYCDQRPLSLVRCPSGVRGQCFYQKHAVQGVPEVIPRVMVDDDREPYLMIDSPESLLSLVHFGVVELHVWGCRADKLNRPDLIVMDLDPSPDVPWSRVARTALALKEQLEVLGLVPFLRSTGGKGLHVVAPLTRRATWDEVKDLTHNLARAFAQRDPKHFTAELAKNRRVGKVFIDYLRNTRHATAVASWSVRAKDGASVALPLAWDQLDLRNGPPVHSIREVLTLIAAPGWTDPWAAFEASRRPITKAMVAAVASLSA